MVEIDMTQASTLSGKVANFRLEKYAISLAFPSAETLNCEIQDKLASDACRKVFIICLDRSGSMEGEYGRPENRPFELAKQMIFEVLDVAFTELDKLYFFLFGETCQVYSWGRETKLSQVKKVIENTTIYGGSVFENFFVDLEEVLQSEDQLNLSTEIYTFMFTDGDDIEIGSHFLLNDPASKYLKLKSNLDTYVNLKVETHVVGFTQEYDLAMLHSLTELNRVKPVGTLQLAHSQVSLPLIVENLVNIYRANNFEFYLTNESAEFKYPILVENSVGYVVADIQKLELDKLYLGVDLKDKTTQGGENFIKLKKVELQPVDTSDIDDNTTLMVLCSTAEYHIKLASVHLYQQLVKKQEIGDVDALLDELQEYDSDLSQVISSATKLSVVARKKTITKATKVKKLVGSLRDALTVTKKGELDASNLAVFHDLSNTNKRDMDLKTQNKLNKRAVENVGNLAKVESKIQKLVQSTDFVALQSQVDPRLGELTKCKITGKDWVATMQGGDCIGLGIYVSRTRAAIYDPTQLEIYVHRAFYLGCEAFMDVLASELTAPESWCYYDSHTGGFNVSTVLEDDTESRGYFNAVLPLFLDPIHWSIASRRAMPLLGFAASGSLNGGSGQELKILPYLVLENVLTDYLLHPSPYSRNLLKLVGETCLRTYTIPFGKPLKDEVRSQLTNFVASPRGRTVDCIPSLEVFLLKLLCAIHEGDVQLDEVVGNFSTFTDYLVEEYVRRVYYAGTEPDFASTRLMDLLNLPLHLSVNQVVDQWEIETSDFDFDFDYDFTFNFQLLLQNREQFVTPFTLPTPQVPLFVFDGMIDFDFAPLANFILGHSWHTSNYDKLLRILNYLKGDFDQVLDSELDSVRGLRVFSEDFLYKEWFQKLNPTRSLALLHQCSMHSKNSERIKAIDKDTYVDFFDPTKDLDLAAFTFIKQEIEKNVNSRRLYRARKHRGRLNKRCTASLATAFLQTNDLDRAAGILKFACRTRSNKLFAKIIELMKEPFPNPYGPYSKQDIYDLQFNKLKMLVDGVYSAIPLFHHKFQKVPSPFQFEDEDLNRWSPSSKNLFEIFINFRGQPDLDKPSVPELDLEEFLSLFPLKREYLIRRINYGKSI